MKDACQMTLMSAITTPTFAVLRTAVAHTATGIVGSVKLYPNRRQRSGRSEEGNEEGVRQSGLYLKVE